MELGLNSEEIKNHRKDLLSEVSGSILEIGIGTGVSLCSYPESVKEITAIEPNDGMKKYYCKIMNKSDIKINVRNMSAELMDFEDETFDYVVSMFTLCSIERVEDALSEIKRVLKPNGKLIFIEHGLSDNGIKRALQKLFKPIQKFLGAGCNLDRNYIDLIKNAKLDFKKIETFKSKVLLYIYDYIYKGVAEKQQG
jgi:ubiquinone/menaquinone biosynthesis C-methylase UbiE